MEPHAVDRESLSGEEEANFESPCTRTSSRQPAFVDFKCYITHMISFQHLSSLQTSARIKT